MNFFTKLAGLLKHEKKPVKKEDIPTSSDLQQESTDYIVANVLSVDGSVVKKKFLLCKLRFDVSKYVSESGRLYMYQNDQKKTVVCTYDNFLKKKADLNAKQQPAQQVVAVKKMNGFEKQLNELNYIAILPDLDAPKLNRLLASDLDELKFANVTKSTPLNKVMSFVVIDLETTGIQLNQRIIEISAIRFDNYYPTECFSTLINPCRSIPADATQINGITDDMVKDAPVIGQIAEQLKSFVGKAPIVCHNASFDIKHLFVSGIDFSKNRIYDTLTLSKKLLKAYNERKAENAELYDRDYDWDVDDYKLDTLCKYYGLRRKGGHRAVSDCLAAGFLFESICNDIMSEYDNYFIDEMFEEYVVEG